MISCRTQEVHCVLYVATNMVEVVTCISIFMKGKDTVRWTICEEKKNDDSARSILKMYFLLSCMVDLKIYFLLSCKVDHDIDIGL
jgi:hypothetical protein